jgi:hypothetical protein
MRTDVLSPRMSRVIEALALDWRHLDARIEGLSGEIETLAHQDRHYERLPSPRRSNRHAQKKTPRPPRQLVASVPY